MAILKKGSRKIVVDGQHYYWRVRNRPSYWQEIFDTPIMFAVQAANGKGAKLIVVLTQAHPGNIWELKPSPVTPSQVAESVRLGLKLGWNPHKPGKAIILGKGNEIQFNEKMVSRSVTVAFNH